MKLKFKTTYIFSVIIFIWIMTSCSTAKTIAEKETTIDTKTTTVETGTIKSTRAGDTLTILVPTLILKDTTIYRRGRTTTIVQRYDEKGNLSIDCISDQIDELKEFMIETLEEKKEVTDEKNTDIKRGWQPIFIAYGFIGLAFLMLVNYGIKKLP